MTAAEPVPVFSDCGRFRYRLDADVDPLTGSIVVAFLMLNPSVAGQLVGGKRKTDPTFTRCVSFAQAIGARRLIIGNLGAYVSTDPGGLRSVVDWIGPDNDRHLAAIVAEADVVVAAWGAAGKVYNLVRVRAPAVCQIARRVGKPFHALRVTKNGAPEHPLYLPAELRPVPWSPR